MGFHGTSWDVSGFIGISWHLPSSNDEQFAIEAMAIETVDLPVKHGDFP